MRSTPKKIYIFSTLILISALLIFPHPAFAAWDWLINSVLGPIFIWVIDFLGGLLIALIQILIGIAQYNDFLDSPAVTKGWIILRDLCNMFFILILLVIAFATVLGSEKYNYKKYLFPLIYMAILINFSKMIAGFFIDISQVVMLQFVNGFKYAAAGNFISSFGLQDLLALREVDPELASQMGSEIFVSLLLALAMLVVALVVTGVIVVVFLLRIIALWILVMLSPVAYLAQATPGGGSYSGMWWSTFSKYCISGPVLAFFLWIALSIMAINPTDVSGTTKVTVNTIPSENISKGLTEGVAKSVAVGISKTGESDRILSFAISIGLLIGALVATQKLGVAGASLAMAAKGKLEAAGKRFAKVGLGIGAVAGTPLGLAAALYKGGKLGLKKGIPYGLRELAATTGVELRPSKIKESIQGAFKRRAQFRELEATAKKGELLEKGGLASRFAFGAPMYVDKFLGGPLGMRGLFGKGGFFRRVPTPKGVEKAEDKLEEKKKRKETILKRLEKGAVADDYREELKRKINEQASKAKGNRAQINDLTGETLRRQAKDLREKATEADKAKNPVAAQNLRDKANVLEQEAERKRVKATDKGSDEYKRIEELKAERRKILQEAKIFGTRFKNLTKETDYKEKEEKARTYLEGERIALESEITQLQKVDPKDPNTFTAEQKELLKKLTKEIDELGEEIDEWGGEKDAPKELVDRWKKKMKEKKAIGSPEDNQNRITDLEERRAVLLERTSGKILEESEMNTLKQEAKALETEIEVDDKKLDQLRGGIPRDYYARQARRRAWAEERSKIDTHEEDELIDLCKSAMARKEKTLVAALLTQIAASGGLNTILNNNKYCSSIQGLNSFTQDILMKKLGMSEQEAFGLENDLCEIASTQANQYTFAKGVGIKNGRYVQQGGTQENPDLAGFIKQQYYAYVEMNKMDKETVARRFSRLGYCSEDPEGNPSFNPAGLWWVRDNWGVTNREINGNRQNANAAQKFLETKTLRQLQDLVRVLPPEKIRDYQNFLENLQPYGKRKARSTQEDQQEMAKFFGANR